MKRIVLIYGSLLAGILIALKLLEYSFFTHRLKIEVYLSIIGIAALAIGVILGIKLKKEKVEVRYLEPEKRVPVPNDIELSQRESEVLEQIALGHSNQEIAENLFVSVNTVKTHINNIYIKLDVKRRTQAISKAKEFGLID